MRLGEIAYESRIRNTAGISSASLMGVSKSRGIVPMRERVQGVRVDRCKIVSPNAFAYNPMRINIGSIARWKGTEKVMVSGDYVVFRCDESQLDPDFLDHFRRTHFWSNFVRRAGDGSVRVRVRIYFSHLSRLKLKVPPIEEQKKIASFLNACDAEINGLEHRLHLLRQQKAGLMQKLLTGKIRVKV